MDIVKEFEDRLNELNRIRNVFREKMLTEPMWEGYEAAVMHEINWIGTILAKLDEPKIDFESLERDD